MKKFYGLSLLIIVMMCVGWVKSSAQAQIEGNYRWEWGYDVQSFDNSNPLSARISGSDDLYYDGTNAYVKTVAYRGKTYKGGFKMSSSNKVTFTVPRYTNYNNPKATVTIAFFIRNDQAESKKLNITIDNNTDIPYTITYSEQSNGYAVITTTLSEGDHDITNPSGNNAQVGIFYIGAEYHINGTNNFRLDNETAGDMLGVWKKYSTSNDMNLYLGGWKYQKASGIENGLIDVLTRDSKFYYDPNYDPENDSNEDEQIDDTEMQKTDKWGGVSEKYKFGEEDPYYSQSSGEGTRVIQPTMGYGADYPYEQYAYNTTDNGRNEYISNGYLGTYSFTPDQEDEGKAAKGDPFTVPCMGDFIKLEPERDGTIKLYLLQNGAIDFDTSNDRKTETDKNKYHGALLSKAYWRPVYIVDEAGTRFGEDDVVAETNTWITIGREDKDAYVYHYEHKKAVVCVDASGNPTIDPGEFVPRGNNLGTVTDKDGNLLGTYNRATYDQCLRKQAKDDANSVDQKRYDFFCKKFKYDDNGILVADKDDNSANSLEVWPASVSTTNQSDNGTGYKTRVWGPRYTGDGWLMISKGYVTYEFKVKAGKSYYIFSNNTKIGFCGYDFFPGAAPDENTTLTLNDDGKIKTTVRNGNRYTDIPGYIEDLSKDNTPKTYAKVALDRTFQHGWNAICLPFSVHEDQMREWFGEGTKSTGRYGNVISYTSSGKEDYELVTYNGVGRDKTDGHLKAFFFHHVYQDIIAGYPYMLYIPKDARALHPETEGLVTFTNVTIEPNAQPLKEFTSSADYMPSELDLSTIAPEKYFTFKGFYSPAEEAAKASQGDYYVLPSGLQLYNDTKESSMKGLRAFMHLNCDEYGAKQMVRIAGTNYSNIIDEMETQWKDATVINEIAEEMGLLPQPSNIYNLSGQLVRQNSVSLIGLPKGVYIVNGKKQLVK